MSLFSMGEEKKVEYRKGARKHYSPEVDLGRVVRETGGKQYYDITTHNKMQQQKLHVVQSGEYDTIGRKKQISKKRDSE